MSPAEPTSQPYVGQRQWLDKPVIQYLVLVLPVALTLSANVVVSNVVFYYVGSVVVCVKNLLVGMVGTSPSTALKKNTGLSCWNSRNIDMYTKFCVLNWSHVWGSVIGASLICYSARQARLIHVCSLK